MSVLDKPIITKPGVHVNTNGPSSIKAEDVTISVNKGKKTIVHEAGIRVDDGEFVGLIGPNGSGKSTLLKTIYRTMSRDSGVIEINGILLDDLSLRDSALMMSVVTQHNYYNFEFNVEDVVAMGRTPHKRSMELDNSEDDRIIRESLEKVNMTEFAKRSFSSLSGGEQQRIILARALAQQTPCMVLDEPTNHLDIKYQLEVLDIVKAQKCTTICALHDLNLAAQYCDRVYVLQDGRIVREGKPMDVINEEMIATIYGVKSSVSVHPKTGQLNVVYFPAYIQNQE